MWSSFFFGTAAKPKEEKIDLTKETFDQKSAAHRAALSNKIEAYKKSRQELRNTQCTIGVLGGSILSYLAGGFVWTPAAAIVAYCAIGKFLNPTHIKFLNPTHIKEKTELADKQLIELLTIYQKIAKDVGPSVSHDSTFLELLEMIAPDVTQTDDLISREFQKAPQDISKSFFDALEGTVHEVPAALRRMLPTEQHPSDKARKKQPESQWPLPKALRSTACTRFSNAIGQLLFSHDSKARKNTLSVPVPKLR